jgi:thiamine-monophosphate kinase
VSGPEEESEASTAVGGAGGSTLDTQSKDNDVVVVSAASATAEQTASGEDAYVAALREVFAARGVRGEPVDSDAWRIDALFPTHVHADMTVEGVDFDRALYPLTYAGHRALAQNLSDLYAADAEPVAFTWSLAVPPAWSMGDVVSFARGAARLAAAAGVPLLGGDLSSTGGPFVCAITCLGRAASLAVARTGAKPGQGIWLSRRVGASGRGLKLLRAALVGESESVFAAWLSSLSEVDRRAVRAHIEPAPFHHLEQLSDYAVAAIDVSDGLLRDAARLAQASGVAIDLTDVDAAVDVAAGAELDDACYGGEDWAVLFAVPEGLEPPGCLRIGQVLAGHGVTVAGRRVDAHGFDHFRAGSDGCARP